MKKILAIVLSLILVLVFAACGQKPADENKDNGSVNNSISGEPGYSFTVKGVKVEFNVLADSILTSLGEPKTYTESASCAFEGLDKIYGYGGYYITTYPNGDKDYINSAEFVDDSVTTAEGIYIGSSTADVEKAYGAGCVKDGSATLTKGSTELLIILEDDAVVSIQYKAILE